MTYGFSRDDIGSYLPIYLKKGLLDFDPFQTIDEEGVGQLIEQSVKAGRLAATKIATTPTKSVQNKNNNIVGVINEEAKTPFKFKAGVCGEQGGDAKSVRFFVKSKMDYVSCSPFRIPVARLAAAQSVIEMELEIEKAKEKQDKEYTNNILVWFKSGKKLYSNRKLY
jgi:pyruvate,orthophosphate dikinase